MPLLEAFLAGFIVGVFGTLGLVLTLRRQPPATTPRNGFGSPPHTDDQAASDIGHKRGIEVFDD